MSPFVVGPHGSLVGPGGGTVGPDGFTVGPGPTTRPRETARVLRRFPHVHEQRRLVTISRLEVSVQRGVGLTTGQGDDPQLMLRCSVNGGMTFGQERWAAMGPIGKYRQRAVFYNLGQARDWVFEIVVSDPVQVALMACSLTIDVGAF